MNILFLIDKAPCAGPSRTGRAVLSLAEDLSPQDEVRVLAMGSPPRRSEEGERGEDGGYLRVELVPEGASGRRLREALGDADLAVAWGTEPSVTRLLAPRARSLRGRLAHVPLGYHPFHLPGPAWTRALYRATQRRLARHAKPLVVQTYEEHEDAQRLLPRAQPFHHPLILPLGHDPETPRRLAHAGEDAAHQAGLPERYALVLGPENANRRVHLASAACRGLNLPLVQLGAPPEAPPSPGLQSVRPSTAEAYYGIFARASVLLSPRRHDPLGHELLDALALGVPFVAHATGAAWGLSSLSRCPLFATTDGPEAWVVGMARGLAHLADQAPPTERLRHAGELYSWTRLAPSWRCILRERAGMPSWFPPRGRPLLFRGEELVRFPRRPWEAFAEAFA